MTFLDCLNWPKFDITQNLSDGKMIKFQQNQALTSHFESFWSIVYRVYFYTIDLCDSTKANFLQNHQYTSKSCLHFHKWFMEKSILAE